MQGDDVDPLSAVLQIGSKQSHRRVCQYRIRLGVNRIHTLLKRGECSDNKKRINCVTRNKDLVFDLSDPVEAGVASYRLERPSLIKPCQCWSMDFIT